MKVDKDILVLESNDIVEAVKLFYKEKTNQENFDFMFIDLFDTYGDLLEITV